MKKTLSFFSGVILGLASLTVAHAGTLNSELSTGGGGFKSVDCPDSMTDKTCNEFLDLQHRIQASSGSTSTFDNIDSLQSPAHDPLCSTDPYSCFTVANQDNTLTAEERQVAIWPVLIYLCCAK